MEIAYLLSHVPDPRLYKRMKIAKKNFEVSVIYWKRSFKNFKTFFEDKDIKKYEVIGPNTKEYNLSVFSRIVIIFRYLFRSLKILRKTNPRIIHCEHLDMLFIAYIYKKIFSNNVSIIYEVADLHKLIYNDSKKIKDIIMKKIFVEVEKILTKSIDKLIITSPHFWDYYYKKFNHRIDHMFIPNAPEKNILNFDFNKKNEKDDLLKNEKKIITIGFIGTVRYYNQLKMLIDEAKKYTNIRIFIAGNGSAYKKIKKYCMNIDFVEIYGPYDYEKEIKKLYSKVDLIYSVYDSNLKNVKIALPNRLYEAIVSKKPIIASKKTKLGEFVNNKNIGYTVSSQGSGDLNSLLEQISKDPSELFNYKEECGKIREEYYMDYYTEKIANMYKKLS